MSLINVICLLNVENGVHKGQSKNAVFHLGQDLAFSTPEILTLKQSWKRTVAEIKWSV